MFSPGAFTGMRLGVILPGDVNTATAVWVAGDTLCVLTKNRYTQYHKAEEGLELVKTEGHTNNWEPAVNTTPVVVGEVAFLVKGEECSWCLVTNGLLKGYA